MKKSKSYKEKYNLAVLVKKIYSSKFTLFTLKTLGDILEIEKKSSLFSVLKRLVEAGVIVRIEKNKYLLKDAEIDDFSLANFLYGPSYVSFESALNFFGILLQFPYQISSATLKKTIEKQFGGKVFAYTRLKKELFFGYEKKENFLIALPEKALLDQLYLVAKGQKTIDFDELDLVGISKTKFKNFLEKYPKTRQFKKIIENFRKIYNF